jgi:hypothetical protein
MTGTYKSTDGNDRATGFGQADYDTYPMPEHGWTCFHCGQTFHNPGSAEEHFGEHPRSVAACYRPPPPVLDFMNQPEAEPMTGYTLLGADIEAVRLYLRKLVL